MEPPPSLAAFSYFADHPRKVIGQAQRRAWAKKAAAASAKVRAAKGAGEEGEGKEADIVIEFTDAELLARLRDTEDNFVERKTRNDKKDWLPAAVAFANSVPYDYPAILFIGVKDDGTLEGGDCNFESLQKSLNKELSEAYPPIYTLPKMLKEGDKECLAVIVPGSRARPHFAGPSYVRVGPETKKASEEQFAVLIAERNSKVHFIRQWVGRTVKMQTWCLMSGSRVDAGCSSVLLTGCNQHYATVQPAGGKPESYPLERVRISFDHESDTLKLEIEG